jgi:hypothetical protein
MHKRCNTVILQKFTTLKSQLEIKHQKIIAKNSAFITVPLFSGTKNNHNTTFRRSYPDLSERRIVKKRKYDE